MDLKHFNAIKAKVRCLYRRTEVPWQKLVRANNSELANSVTALTNTFYCLAGLEVCHRENRDIVSAEIAIKRLDCSTCLLGENNSFQSLSQRTRNGVKQLL